MCPPAHLAFFFSPLNFGAQWQSLGRPALVMAPEQTVAAIHEGIDRTLSFLPYQQTEPVTKGGATGTALSALCLLWTFTKYNWTEDKVCAGMM